MVDQQTGRKAINQEDKTMTKRFGIEEKKYTEGPLYRAYGSYSRSAWTDNYNEACQWLLDIYKSATSQPLTDAEMEEANALYESLYDL